MRPGATAAAVVLLSSLSFPSRAEEPLASGPTDSPPPARLSIVSDSDCPSGSAITAELAEVLPSGEGPSGTVRVRSSGDKLIVDLLSDATTQRELAVAGDCRTRAITVALVVATWTGELSTAASTEPSLRPVPEAAPPAPVLAPARDTPVSTRELGAGLLLSMSGGPAPGVEIDYVQTRAPRGLGWQAGLVVPARRESTGSGLSTRWTRLAGDVAVNGRITLDPVALSASAGLLGAYSFISARGYDLEGNARAFTVGVVTEARAAIPWGRLRVWTALRGGRWLLPQSIIIETQDGDRVATVDLPSWDFQCALGLSYPLR